MYINVGDAHLLEFRVFFWFNFVPGTSYEMLEP